MNSQSVLQAFSTALQSNTTTPPPVPTTIVQTGLIQDHAHAQDQAQDFAIAQQSISTAPPPIPTALIQQNSMPLPLEGQYSSRQTLYKAI